MCKSHTDTLAYDQQKNEGYGFPSHITKKVYNKVTYCSKRKKHIVFRNVLYFVFA